MRSKSTIKFPPGVFKGASPADAKPRWYDSNLMRWQDGRLQPVGGYKPAGYVTASPIRRILTWSDNAGNVRTALLCEQHLYVLYNGVLTDVSPSPPIAPPVSQVPVGGFGNGLYSGDAYGTQRPLPQVALNVGNTFTLGTWGQTLLAMTSADGRLLQWDPAGTANPNVAVAVTNAPTNNRTFSVTPERFCILLGAGGDPRHVYWCSQQNLNDWSLTNVSGTAGDNFVEPSASILCSILTKQGTLFFTESAAYFLAYQGTPFIYSLSRVGGNCTPVSGQATVEFGNRVVWLSNNGFWLFDGNSITPLSSDLFDWFKRTSDSTYTREYTIGVNLGQFSEIYWFFPARGAVTNTMYMVWNFADNWWATGYVGRTAGEAGRYNTYPTFADGVTMMYHELGTAYSDGAIAYASSSSLNIGDGRNSTLFQIMPDHDGAESSPLFDFYSYQSRINQASPSSSDDHVGPLVSQNGYVDVRITGRDFTVKVSSPDSATNMWTLGESYFDLRPRGFR